MELYPDVMPTLDVLSRSHKLALVSNIDDDLLGVTPLGREFDLVCTAERARGYKPDGTLFRYLLEVSGLAVSQILHRNSRSSPTWWAGSRAASPLPGRVRSLALTPQQFAQ